MSNCTQGRLKVKRNFETEGREIFVGIDAAAICKMYDNNSAVRSREEAIANAERIVKCWNCHDDLLEACKYAKDIIKRLADEGNYPDFLLADNGGQGIKIITDAINKAEVKSK